MRLLLLSASAGAGHVRAAQALEEAFKKTRPDLEVRHEDILDFTTGAYKKAYVGSFLAMANHAPALWGYLYAESDEVKERRVRDRFMRFFNKLEFARFRRFVREYAPDAVLSTHFLTAQVYGPRRRTGRDSFPLALAVTDFDVHAYWVEPTIDRYFVASDELKARLSGRGIPAERIAVTGIPIASSFSRRWDRGPVFEKHSLSRELPSVLLMGGGAGVGTLEEAARAILQAGPLQLLAVCGRNEELRGRIASLPVPAGSVVKAFGFVDPIAELMAVADVAVTKSGGLTTSECLAMGVPLIVRDPIPGQEDRNCDFVLEAGAGLKAYGPESLSFKLSGLLRDPARLKRMREAARQAGRPRAAEQIAAAMMVSSGT